jgi:hypothetical protein
MEELIASGWKPDDDRETEEFVLFVPWKEVPQRFEFPERDGLQKYGKTKEYITEADIKHVRMPEIGE